MKAFLSSLQMLFVALLSIQRKIPFKGGSKVVSPIGKNLL
jgi:hypothetical protein